MDSNFGRSMLQKYGWKDGQGLGKEESGITTAIKVKGNFNAYGLGHDVGKEFTSQWWDHVYNKTAENITVGKSEDGSVQLTRKDEHHITQKVIPYSNASSSQYSSFVKAGVLTGVEEEKDMSLKLSYDELFKICGGSTAHKGARHGITMSAKLARVEKQERELMEKWGNSKDKPSQESEVIDEKNEMRKKRKKSKDKDRDLNSYDTVSSQDFRDEELQIVEHEHLSKKHKKDKKKKKKRDIETESPMNCNQTEICNEESLPLERSCAITGEFSNEVVKPKQSKKERRKLTEAEDSLGIVRSVDDPDIDEGNTIKKANKKKKNSKADEKENTAETEMLTFESERVEKKKKHKKTKKEKDDKCQSLISEDVVMDSEQCNGSNNMEIGEQTEECHKRKKKKCKHKKNHL